MNRGLFGSGIVAGIMLSNLDVSLPKPAAYGIAVYPPGATYGPRTSSDWEFVWIIEGSVEYAGGNRSILAPAGAILLCRPGTTDFFQWDRQLRTRHGYFHFDIKSVPDDWPAIDDWPLVRQPGNDDVLRPLFRHVLRGGLGGSAWQTRLAVATMLAAFVSGEYTDTDTPRDKLPEPVARATTLIRTRLVDDPAADIQLHELAAIAGVTPEHLCRLFKSATGRSPIETVRLARLDRAAVLLARSNYTVGDIAALCGFASPFHFSKRFKAAFGRAPREFRKAIDAGGLPPVPRLAHPMQLPD